MCKDANIVSLTEEIWERFVPELSSFPYYTLTNNSLTKQELFTTGMNFAIIKEDDILAIVGATRTLEFTLEVSIITSATFKDNKRLCVNKIHKVFYENLPKDICRLEGHVDIEDKRALRFANFFGFESVGVRSRLGKDKKTYVLVEKLI